MQYKFEKTDQDYSDLASGKVFYSLPGHPAFPVRLASEIFQRCMAHRSALYDASTPCVLYDPCCGAAYHLSVLAYLHGTHIQKMMASDVDAKALEFASRNLGLFSAPGIDRRINEITAMIGQYNKDSHRDALKSAQLIKDKITALNKEHSLTTEIFQSSATDSQTMLEHIQPQAVDVVFTDIPYGQHSTWQGTSNNPLGSMLDALFENLSLSSVVAIASDKGQKVFHERYQRVEQFQVGKRRVTILKLV